MTKRSHCLFRLAAAVIVLAGMAGASLGACSSDKYSGPPASLTVAWSPFESTALFWIARDRQFFPQNGLELTLRKYDSGSASLTGVLKGEADGVAEFPVVRNVFQQASMAILSSADKGDYIYLVGRKDRGIARAADLKQKKVGVAFGTIAQFYLGRYLELNGVNVADVNMVDLKTPAEWANAVVNGDVDAVVTAQPDANTARERLGDNGVIWPVQSGQFLNGLVVSTKEWAAAHPDLSVRFLKALAQAEEYAFRNPVQSKDIVQKALGFEPGYMDTVWAQNQFTLSLDQALITAMEDEARWLIANNLTTGTQVPDFIEYIYEDALKTVKPAVVSIVRQGHVRTEQDGGQVIDPKRHPIPSLEPGAIPPGPHLDGGTELDAPDAGH